VPNTILTIISAGILAALIWPTVRFLLIDAVWTGSDRHGVPRETAGRPVGACWPLLRAKFDQFMYGFYPASERWRVNVTYALGWSCSRRCLIPSVPYSASRDSVLRHFPGRWIFPAGRRCFWLPHVETSLWAGCW